MEVWDWLEQLGHQLQGDKGESTNTLLWQERRRCLQCKAPMQVMPTKVQSESEKAKVAEELQWAPWPESEHTWEALAEEVDNTPDEGAPRDGAFEEALLPWVTPIMADEIISAISPRLGHVKLVGSLGPTKRQPRRLL
ncbi:hypothetical protein NDU88_003341 [Pleurodeles waltl]|uniref:Uncharacterized protein n=1 Tax=Pleurodeles waltl TaxID=8319 RepID=A0AAV7UC74_PLEWA|nr:hypothetical protein NDU88_003341 [Pleurodeles waltl]